MQIDVHPNIHKNIIYNENKIYFMSTQITNRIYQYDLVQIHVQYFLTWVGKSLFSESFVT